MSPASGERRSPWWERTDHQGTAPALSVYPLVVSVRHSDCHHLQDHLRDQPTHRVVFYLNSLLPNNHELPNSSESIHPVGLWPPAWPTCLCGLHTYLSRGFYSHGEDVALQGLGRFFLELAEKHEGAERLLRCKTSAGAAFPSRTCWSLPRTSGQNSGRHRGRLALERNLTQALWELQALVLLADPRLCDFLQNHFRGEEVKLFKEMGPT
ncbi:hypothetical protein QTO34_016519 [Cnephaeus nilssonii]|uniref:Ferritin light chain n=1 Tax=Cnephaeus nilssonii TaxID=3371016 RepID=A0AA40I2G1_CNENI|nr:hypothetical protein QTO34_016519 [Eptesicus nilssonii]